MGCERGQGSIPLPRASAEPIRAARCSGCVPTWLGTPVCYSSEETKTAVKACPGKGGLVRKEVRKGKWGISRQSLVEERVAEIALPSQLGWSQQVSVLEQNNEVTCSATLCFSFWFGVFLFLKKKI